MCKGCHDGNCVRTTVANRDKSHERQLSMLAVNKITDVICSKLTDMSVDALQFQPLAILVLILQDVYILLGEEIFYELLRPGPSCAGFTTIVAKYGVRVYEQWECGSSKGECSAFEFNSRLVLGGITH